MSRFKHEDDRLNQVMKEVIKEYGYLDIKEMWKRYNQRYGNENRD